MDYLELDITISPRNPWSEIIMIELSEQGFESFVETENGLLAYAPTSEIDLDNPTKYFDVFSNNAELEIQIESKIIPQQNWNAVWEADFKPVHVEDYLSIVAPFHDKQKNNPLVVEILPQMSFGTGHHQTTYLMSKALFELSSVPNKVLDMGTGTGVLAILAEKLGAKDVLAVDIEDWSVENTIENAQRNDCTNIRTLCGDVDDVQDGDFGLILANINKNVLKAHMPNYAEMIAEGGILMLSGFFNTDIDELLNLAQSFDFELIEVQHKDEWAMLKLSKK